MSGILKIQRCSGLFYVWLLLAMVSWGSSWVNAKVLSGYLNAFEMIFLRFGIAFFALMPIIWSTERSFRISLKSFSISIILALFLMAYNYSYFLGATFGMASLGGAMVNTMAPILTFILLVLLGVRMMSVYEGLALCLGIAGVLIMLHIWQFEIEKIINSHNLYFFASALVWSIFSIISAKVENTSALLLSLYIYGATIVIDGVLFVDFSAIAWEKFNITAWGNLIALSLFSTVFGNAIYFLGIKKLGVAKVSIFGFLIPFASIFSGAIFLGESIDIFVIIGTILTLFAIRILNHTTSKR